MTKGTRRWLLVFLLSAPEVAAQSRDPVAAEALFQDARRLMEANRMSAACPKLEESQRLDPAVGTLMYLALCYERTDRNASAWSTYRMAESAARNAGQLERVEIARARAAALESTLSRLVLRVAPNNAPDIVIKRDGVVLGRAAWGVSVPVDPGRHQIGAAARNRKPFVTTVDVPTKPTELAVDVPILEPLASGNVAGLTPKPMTTSGGASGGDPTQRPYALGTQGWAGIGLGAVGVTGLIVGTVFAVRSKSKEADAEPYRRPGTNVYDDPGYEYNQQALDSARAARWSYLLGGVAIACGVTLVLTAPRTKSTALALRLQSTSDGAGSNLTLQGGWM